MFLFLYLMLSREEILKIVDDSFDLGSLNFGQIPDRHVALRHLHLTTNDVEAARGDIIYFVFLEVFALIDKIEESFGVGRDALREIKAVAQSLDLVVSRY